MLRPVVPIRDLHFHLKLTEELCLKNRSGQLADRFGNQFAYWQVLWATGFGKSVIGAEKSASYITGNLREKLSRLLAIAVAVVVHQITHNIAGVRHIRQGRVTYMCTAGAITAAGFCGIFP
jgi:hypothetical protein